MKKIDQHIFGGMQRDMSISKQKPEFLWEAHNIRLTAREGDTMLSITNEKGTSEVNGVSFTGNFLGYYVLGNYLVVFTIDITNNVDYIYRIDKSNDYEQVTLYQGNLGFSIENPIETLGVYENEFIQKVYWVDSVNQPRVINIVKDSLLGQTVGEVRASYNDSSFDFVQELSLNESIKVYKESSSSGMFAAGTIQYAISYYNKYGQESNLAYVTPLYYTSYPNRGGSPEDKLGNAFRLNISGVDNRFDYLRIYSIFRTSKDAVPTVKRVVDLELNVANKLTLQNAVNSYYFTSNIKEAIQVNYVNGGGWVSIAATNTDKNPVQPTDYMSPVMFNGQTYKYYVYKKSEYPYLLLRDTSTGYYYTYGNADTICITSSMQTGASGKKYYILGNGGQMVRASYANYGAATEGLTYIDNGQSGDTIDPTQLLYIGGEDIVAGTITAKDGTMFLGNVKINRMAASSVITGKDYASEIKTYRRAVYVPRSMNGTSYSYYNTLNAKEGSSNSNPTTNASGFKYHEKYRLGMQFQYKNGKWSEPIFIADATQGLYPTQSGATLQVPDFYMQADLGAILALGYKRVRPIVVFPTLQERRVIAQGLLAPTVYSIEGRANGTPYAQSSWFFRLNGSSNIQNIHGKTLYGGWSKNAEIQGVPKELSNISASGIGSSTKVFIGAGGSEYVEVSKDQMSSIFAVDQNIVTMHSPDLEFDDTMSCIDYSTLKLRLVGTASFNYDTGDIDIETSSPTVSHEGAGFVHHTYAGAASSQLCAGLFYDDYLADEYDSGQKFQAYIKQKHSFLFMVYPWHKSGSLNNDTNRPTDGGTRSAVLKRKKISNLKYSSNITWTDASTTEYDVTAQIFDFDQVQLTKVNGHSYYGNVDTMLAPVAPYGSIFASGSARHITDSTPLPNFNSTNLLMITKYGTVCPASSTSGYAKIRNQDVGDDVSSLKATKEAIRMKYKSSPHFVFQLNNSNSSTLPTSKTSRDTNPWLWLGELYRTDNEDLMFGGTGDDALKANLWIPCGESVPVNSVGTNTTVTWKYGDTWYQRYDCLKTYPFTMEDENSIVDIASFMCETRVNIDGRYDKNRGQDSNLYMSPTNFNLMNQVYSQEDTFFNYRLLDNDYYNLNNFPASVMWSLQKESAAVVDNWTNITLANILDLDGSKGSVNALRVWNDNIYCFQDTGISNILFNSRVQIPTSDNNPIEISNNYKVDGERYLSNNLGCRNKWSICVTESGIYFIDSVSNALYNLGNGLTDVSDTHGFSHWFDEQFSDIYDTPFNPFYYEKTFYDKNRTDLYISTTKTALCFSELLGQFTSFMSYKNPDAMFNIGADFYAIKNNKLWKMFEGEYNSYFGSYEPFDITFISNNDSADDKVFTNLELRADFYADYALQHNNMFNYIRAWNEYQDTGKVPLSFAICKPSNLKKKFRIWRIDIPRDKSHKLDRIRNTWTKIQLGTYSNSEFESSGLDDDKIKTMKKSNMELHDVIVDYFS